MTVLRGVALPFLLFALAFVAVDYGRNPGRYHQVAIVGKLEPLKPNPNLPTFAQATAGLRGKDARAAPSSPFGPNEHIFQHSRIGNRESLLKKLYMPWSDYCTPEGRKRFGDSLTTYFWRRGNETKAYAKNWGPEGAAYIKREWGTPDDLRIEQRVAELYERGFIDEATVKPYVIEHIKTIVGNVKVQGQPCKG